LENPGPTEYSFRGASSCLTATFHCKRLVLKRLQLAAPRPLIWRSLPAPHVVRDITLISLFPKARLLDVGKTISIAF
jgi:hypothetical protein